MDAPLGAAVWAAVVAVCGVVAAAVASRLLTWGQRSEHFEVLEGKHVLVTGGSSGIGKEVAKLAFRSGAHVSIVARDAGRLESAKREISEGAGDASGKVLLVQLDVTEKHPALERAVKEAVEQLGPVFVLVNCAGGCIPGSFERLTPEEFGATMDLNFFGSANATRAVLPSMKESGNGGRVIFVASQAALIGLYGMTAYSASKYAVRGLAECLAMEMAPFDITVTVNCPPDTATPGFEEENVRKPEETKLMCEGAGPFRPEDIARRLLADGLEGKFLSSSGMDGRLLTDLNSGLVYAAPWDMLRQVLVLPLFRIIGWFTVARFYSIVKECHRKRNASKKSD